MSKEQEPYISPFEAVRKETEEGIEYWTARDLARILEYNNYRNFLKVIAKAKIACETSGQAISDHMKEQRRIEQQKQPSLFDETENN